MSEKHTPGPWTFDGDYVWAESIRCYVADPQTEDILNGENLSRAEARKQWPANGLLIAAAPELLGIAVDALALIGDLTDSVRYTDRVQALEEALGAVIAKATGATHD